MVDKKIVLITGARAPIALDLCRKFCDAGYQVHLADSVRFALASFSQKKTIYHRLPSPRFETGKFIERLVQLCSLYNVTHLIPTCEETFYISQNLDQFSCKVWTDNIEKLRMLHHKFNFSQSECFRTPISYKLTEFKHWNNSHNYVFKPIYSRFASKVIMDKKVAPDDFEFPERWMAQEKALGEEVCVTSLWDNGNLCAMVVYKPKLRAGKGAGILLELTTHEKLTDLVKKAGKELAYTGFLSFDVMLNGKECWFLECNPRGTSGVHFMPNIVVQMSGTITENGLTNKAIGLKFLILIYHTRYFFKSGRTISDIVFSKNDVVPLFGQLFSFLELMILSMAKRISLVEAGTYDIEWNGE